MKHLKIETWETQWGWILQIKEQTHRESYFGRRSDEFLSSGKFLLKSVSHPDYMRDTPRGESGLYVRGYGRGDQSDNVRVFLFGKPNIKKWLKKLDEAVKEYNEAFKD